MAKILLVLTVASVGLYLIVVITAVLRSKTKANNSDQSPKGRPSYSWGLMYAALFYYGLPVWLWRYGTRNSLKLILSCVLAVAAIQALFRYAGLIEVSDFGESLAFGFICAVPVRAAAGFWVARNDSRWRQAILSRRMAAKNASKNNEHRTAKPTL